ncbi:insulin receptor substrate 1-like [Paroedura picta]|uniref:insulin receptor substrate 1-like n=1 Tax=Paroedura picta TaxID=143630 RepID=UPI0040562737
MGRAPSRDSPTRPRRREPVMPGARAWAGRLRQGPIKEGRAGGARSLPRRGSRRSALRCTRAPPQPLPTGGGRAGGRTGGRCRRGWGLRLLARRAAREGRLVSPSKARRRMEGAGGAGPSDVRLCGYLRKAKSQRRRFFVLRCSSPRGPARLEYYESEKKFRAGGAGARPRRAFPLARALSISRRADARHRHLLVLCGPDGTFGVAAESAEQQQAWFAALEELRAPGQVSRDGDGDSALPSPAFKEAWQVSLRPRGLGHTKQLAGTYLLCLTDKTISFVKLNTAVAAVVLQLLNVRRCGHSENYFFMEVGRSAATGPGELWMQVEDLVVAQHMHETILEAMRALSEEFRTRSKSQALASAPISVPPRHQPLGTPPPGPAALPRRPRPEGACSLDRQAGVQKPGSWSDCSGVSSDEGGSSPADSRSANTLGHLSLLVSERSPDYISMRKLALPDGRGLAQWGLEPNKRASLPPLALEKDRLPRRKPPLRPVATSASYPEGLNRSADPGYMAMLPGGARSAGGQAYISRAPARASPPQESGGYMLMSPSGSCSPEGPSPWGAGGGGCDYMNMSPLSRSASSSPPEHSPLLAPSGGAGPFCSLPRCFKNGPRPSSCPFLAGRLSNSSSTSSDSLEEPARAPPPGGRGSGEYVRIEYTASDTHRELGAVLAEAKGGPGLAGDGAAAAVTWLVQADAQGLPLRRLEGLPDGEQSRGPPDEAEPGLNYIDLDLAKEAGAEGCPSLRAAAPCSQALHAYASIDFHHPWKQRRCPLSPEQAGEAGAGTGWGVGEGGQLTGQLVLGQIE